MELDTWVNGCKVRLFPWIDGKHYYMNVMYYKPGQSIEQPPAWDKTVYITINDKGTDAIRNFLSSLVNYISKLSIKAGQKVVLTF
jgi:hypothetical protein